jgi:prolyl oligopeptidase
VRVIAVAIFAAVSMSALAQTEDPYLWLEDVTGDKAMAWVKEQDAQSRKELEGSPQFEALHKRLVDIYNSRDRIPMVTKRGEWLYNFWQDAEHPRGLWRRTTLEEYRKPAPQWQTIIDVDALAKADDTPWAWKGADCLKPDYRHCLVMLSRGGSDANVIREFDLATKAFVKDGFTLPESKGQAEWVDADTLYIARDFGEGTLTTSGYPRVIKEWKRGTPLAQARTIFEGQATDVSSDPVVIHEKGRRYELLTRGIKFFETEQFIKRGDKFVRIEVPLDAKAAVAQDKLFVELRTAWKPRSTEFKAGSLVAIDLDTFMDGGRDFTLLFEPTERVSLQSFSLTRSYVLLDILDHVQSRIAELCFADGKWQRREVAVPKASSIGVGALDRDDDDRYWMTVTSFVQPTTLYLAKAGSGEAPEKLKSLPAFFNAEGLEVAQYEATASDGVRIPYFVVSRKDAKRDGTAPTILYGYGGFEIAMTPSYSATIGAAWLERGGTWVLANIRGGGEFGPEWHHVAIREGRVKTHGDFIAVAEDLEKRGISSPKHLGIMGGSQGGLLVGAAFTQRPELFRAVVCSVPLLDMKRYHKMLAGASWMAEYGDPDKPEDWAFISKYSPYQNVAKDRKYPRVFFTTSTRDDRVHPGHARKMVARMKEQGHDVLYFEYTEGGHGSGVSPAQQAYTWALIYTFFMNELK